MNKVRWGKMHGTQRDSHSIRHCQTVFINCISLQVLGTFPIWQHDHILVPEFTQSVPDSTQFFLVYLYTNHYVLACLCNPWHIFLLPTISNAKTPNKTHNSSRNAKKNINKYQNALMNCTHVREVIV